MTSLAKVSLISILSLSPLLADIQQKITVTGDHNIVRQIVRNKSSGNSTDLVTRNFAIIECIGRWIQTGRSNKIFKYFSGLYSLD